MSWTIVATLGSLGVTAVAPQSAPPVSAAQSAGTERTETAAALRGRVLDERGLPVRDAAVAVVDEEWTTELVLTTPHARSDAAGRFTFAASIVDAVPGGCAIVIAAPGRATVELRHDGDIYFPFATLAACNADLDDVMLPAAATVHGRLRTREAAALAGADVDAACALQAVVRPRSWWTTRFRTKARTANDGSFELRGAATTGVRVSARAIGYHRHTVPWATAAEPLLFELSRSGEVRGRLLDADGAPVRGQVFLRHGRETGTVQRTGHDGSFRLGIELPGAFTVHGRRFGAYQEHDWANTGKRSEPAVDVELRLPAMPTVRLSVRAGGRPVEGASAHLEWLLPGAAPQQPIEALLAVAPRRTDAAGEVSLPGPAAGANLLGVAVVRAPGHAPAVRRDLRYLRDGDPFAFELARGATIMGVVRAHGGGEPIAGARVASPGREWSSFCGVRSQVPVAATTDAEGRFRLEHVGAGPLTLCASAPGYSPCTPVTVEVDAHQQAAALTFDLEPCFTIRGRLNDTPPVAGWRVRVERAEGAPDRGFAATQSPLLDGLQVPDPQGAFAVQAWLGRNRVQMAMPVLGYTTGRLVFGLGEVPVTGDVAHTFDLKARLPGRLRGTVKLAGAGPPPHRLAVVLSDVDFVDGPVAARVLDAHGRFDLPVLASWHAVRVVDVATGLVLGERNVAFAPAATTELDLDLTLAEVQLQVKGEADRLARRFLQVAMAAETDEARAVEADAADDLGCPLDLAEGATTFPLFAPAGRLRVRLLAARGPGRTKPLAEAELRVRIGGVNTLELVAPE